MELVRQKTLKMTIIAFIYPFSLRKTYISQRKTVYLRHKSFINLATESLRCP